MLKLEEFGEYKRMNKAGYGIKAKYVLNKGKYEARYQHI